MIIASSMMLIIAGVDLVAVAPGGWFVVGDILIGAGLAVFSAMVYRA
jgi:hypothetical protein